MRKYNIFQGGNGIEKVIYEELGYEKTQYMDSSITENIYFETYFYLCNRFGNPIIVDDYKRNMVWRFEVKQYSINIELNSSWVTFMIFGNGSSKNPLSKNNFINYSIRSPYRVRYWRDQKKNRSKLLNLLSEKPSKRELKLRDKLWKEFFDKNGLESDEWTEERFQNEKQENGKTKSYEYFEYLENYNISVINIESFKHYEHRGYSNSKTKHALKTLRQFLRNMHTPIWVRDCGFNIKGRCGSEYDKYIGNIEIKFLNKSKRQKKTNK
jgi:hypothetical protein